MPIVDAHVHIYPSKIAQRAVESVRGFSSLGAVEGVEGTVESLLSQEDSPITHRIVYSVAIKPSNVASINDFIAAECATHPNLFGFMAMHQDFEDPETEIERAMGLGLRGIKLHPDTQAVNADDPRLMTIYEIAQAKHLPVVIHSGDYRYDYSHPRAHQPLRCRARPLWLRLPHVEPRGRNPPSPRARPLPVRIRAPDLA